MAPSSITKLRRMRSFQLFTALLVLTGPSGVAEVICTQSADHLVIKRNGRHVLTYNKTDSVPDGVDPKYARSGFIHPISTPTGRILTDGYPLPHHTHQHGIFFAWTKASFEGKEVNFWEHTPNGATVRHDKVLELTNKEAFAEFRVRLVHVRGEKEILHEIWTVRVHAKNGFIDFTSEQSCATKSPLILHKYHYGAMAIRGSRQWFDLDFEKAQSAATKNGTKLKVAEPCEMLTSEGHTRANGNHTRPQWVSMTGLIDNEPVALTLVPHPSNFRHPQHVRLHPNMPYFCFIPTVEKGFRIEPNKPWISRYRIVAQDGKPDPARLNKIQSTFAREK